MVIFDDELSGSQQRNIEDRVGVRVNTRSRVFLHPEPIPKRENFRLNWHSCVTGCPDCTAAGRSYPDWAEESAPEGREKRSWKQISGISGGGWDTWRAS